MMNKPLVKAIISDIIFGIVAALFISLIAKCILIPFVFDISKTAMELTATALVGAKQAADASAELTIDTIGGVGGIIIHVLQKLNILTTFSLLFGIRFVVAYISGGYSSLIRPVPKFIEKYLN